MQSLNAVRLLLVLMVGFGYASTMNAGPETAEWGRHFDYDPSWFGLQVLFLLSGYMAWRSLERGRSAKDFLLGRARRTWPVLALYTLAVVSLLYPALCQPGQLDAAGLKSLGLYLVKTLTLVSPGGVMPGALDDQPYACLLQGTVWTLRWGALLHIATLVMHRVGLRASRLLLAVTVVAVIAYIIGFGAYVWGGKTWLEPLAPAFRFAYPWLFGVWLYSIAGRTPKRAAPWAIGAAIGFALAGLHYVLLPWSPAIEILGTLSWSALAIAMLHRPSRLMSAIPPLALPVYLGIWPVTQTLLYLMPEIGKGQLIALSLSVSLGLGYAVWLLLRGVLRPPAASQLKSPRTA